MKTKLQLLLLLLACASGIYAQKAGTKLSSFGNNGEVYLANPNYSLVAEKSLIDANGKLLVLYSDNNYPGPYYSYLTRFNTDGSVDNTFGYGGTGTYNMRDEEMYAKHFAVAPNGRIAILGQRNFNGDTDLELVVLNSSGQLDMNFSGDGKILFSNSSMTSETPNGVVILPSGKIVVAENYYSPTSANKYGVMLQRVDSIGAFDASYGTLSYIVSEIPGVIPFFKDIYQTGNYIVGVGGYDSLAHLDGSETLIGVFTDAGAYANYGVNGYWLQHEADAYNSGRSFESALRLMAGEVISSFSNMAGFPSQQYTDARVYYNNGANYANANMSDMVTKGFLQQPDGKIVLCGTQMNNAQKIMVRRLTSSLGFDNSFAASSNFTDTTDYYSWAKDAVYSADDKLYVVCTVIKIQGQQSQVKIICLRGVDAPNIELSCPATVFNSTVGVATPSQMVTMNVIGITSAITIAAPNGFEVSVNGTSYTQQATIPANVFANGTASFFLRFNPQQAGVFNGDVTATAPNASATLAVSGSTPTGVESVNEVAIQIYPNPVGDFLNITTNAAIQKVELVNVQGKVIQQSGEVNGSTILISTTAIPSGSYFCVVQTNGGVVVKKILKL